MDKRRKNRPFWGFRPAGAKGYAMVEVMAIMVAISIAVGLILLKMLPGRGSGSGMVTVLEQPGDLPSGVAGDAADYMDLKRKLKSDVNITYTKKIACHANRATINAKVEEWAIWKDGKYPKNDLSDIGHDRKFFPQGVPLCPVDGKPYFLDPVMHRVMGHEHPDITGPVDEDPFDELLPGDDATLQ